MNGKNITVIWVVALMANGAPLALAQQLATNARGALTHDEAVEMAEDLEIMSTILHETLKSVYGKTGLTRTVRINEEGKLEELLSLGLEVPGLREEGRTPVDAPVEMSKEISKPLGTYLPGYGVVYQVPVSAPREPAPEQAKQDAPSKELSRWDRVRQDLREDQLWAHGRGMSRKMCQQCHAFEVRDQQGPRRVRRAPGDVFLWQPQQQSSDEEPRSATRVIQPRRELRNGIVATVEQHLGGPSEEDLIKAVVDALAENGRNFRHLKDAESLVVVLNYHRRTDVSVEALEETGVGKESVQGMVATLPNRIMITASKRQLDKVAQGQISQEEFRSGLHILRFDPRRPPTPPRLDLQSPSNQPAKDANGRE